MYDVSSHVLRYAVVLLLLRSNEIARYILTDVRLARWLAVSNSSSTNQRSALYHTDLSPAAYLVIPTRNSPLQTYSSRADWLSPTRLQPISDQLSIIQTYLLAKTQCWLVGNRLRRRLGTHHLILAPPTNRFGGIYRRVLVGLVFVCASVSVRHASEAVQEEERGTASTTITTDKQGAIKNYIFVFQVLSHCASVC